MSEDVRPPTVLARLRQFVFPRPVPIVLVVGCARSGTSILGELLAAHPAVRYVFEASSAWDSAGPGENDGHRLTEAHASGAVRRRLRAQFGELAKGGAIVVEKSPRNSLRIPFLRAVFPEAQYVAIVRDGRDVACSLMPGIGGDEWRHLKPPNWNELLTRETGIVRCAESWRTVMEILERDLASVKHLLVRYEELVADPSAVARNLASHLRLEAAPAMLEFAVRIQDRTEGSYQARRQDQWFRADHAVRVGRWRENLSPAERDAVHARIGATLRRWGYPVPPDPDPEPAHGGRTLRAGP